MQTNIPEKIDLFKRGLISENQEIIGYDKELHNQFSNLLDNYWTSKLQYVTDNFISESDILAVSASTDTFPVSSDVLNTNNIAVTPDEIQDITGIDFQNDLGITGPEYETLTGDIADFSSTLYSTMTDDLDDISARMLEVQEMINADIGEIEEQPQFSDGMTEMIKLSNTYLDNNDTRQFFKQHLQTALDAMNIQLSTEDLNFVLDKIIQTSQAKFGQKITNITSESLYSLLDDQSIESIISQALKLVHDIICDDTFKIARAVVKLMPPSFQIYNNSPQIDLFKTIEALIKQIDVFRNIAIQKGYLDYGKGYCED